MSIGLRIEVEEVEKRFVLRLEGRIDASTASILENKINTLLGESKYYLILDFSLVDYLSSAGMRVLLSSAKQVKGKNGTFVLFAISEEVGEIIKMAGFDKILQICGSEKEALQLHK